MKSFRLIVHILSFTITGNAQPYIDLINTRYLNSPNNGIWRQNEEKIKINYYNFSTTLPLQFKNKNAFIFSPYYEQWEISSYYKFKTKSWALPLSFLKNFKNNKWSLLATVIVRANKETAYNAGRGDFANYFYQYGGAVIGSYKKDGSLTFKAGLYYNKEFFGNFYMPLLGIDWKLNGRNNLFGVLPGNMSLQSFFIMELFSGLLLLLTNFLLTIHVLTIAVQKVLSGLMITNWLLMLIFILQKR
jgi:hypothetical protein